MEPVHSCENNKININESSKGVAEYTYAHVANVFFIADGLIGFIRRWRTGRSLAITEARRSTAIVVTAFVAHFQFTVTCTTGSLTGTADNIGAKSKK